MEYPDVPHPNPPPLRLQRPPRCLPPQQQAGPAPHLASLQAKLRVEVSTIDMKESFYVTFVYAFNDENGRKKLWYELQELHSLKQWIVMGDFNDILSKEERIGKRVRFSTSADFVDCIAHCRLEDVKFSGSFYTWCNKQFGDDRIYSKIDRVLANSVEKIKVDKVLIHGVNNS
uniref:Uncharacterized protein n=1 Tax=Cannabis sativa TaxID=3483 RepID=A0A803QBN3_CANSA